MLSKEWWLEHFVEVISLIVSIAGFIVAGTYLVKINKNQNLSIASSPNAQAIQIHGPVTNSQINNFREGSKKEVAVSELPVEKEQNPKKLIDKIEGYLDDGEPISTIVEMSLRLSKQLKMEESEKWLEKEVMGYHEYAGEEPTKTGLKMKKKGKEDEHRRVNSELNVQVNNEKIETFKIPMFISQPVRKIEELANSKGQLIVINAPPLEMMVKILNVAPEERVPYLVNISEFKNILLELRQKIIDFLDKAKDKLNSSNISTH